MAAEESAEVAEASAEAADSVEAMAGRKVRLMSHWPRRVC